MIVLNLIYKRLFAIVLAMVLVSCSNPWDDRENNGDINLNINLTEAITSTAEVSQFGQLLVQTGYDKILASSKTYTVFAPTNDAMAQVDSGILNDPETLKTFVANHIALTAYSSERKEEETQIKMHSNKYLFFKGATLIDDASIVSADHYAANGVFHIIDKPLTVKLNIWEYINSQAGVSQMSDYLLSLKEFSIYKADSVAKLLAEERGPGYFADSLTNSYLKNVYNLNNEKNSYTLFLMEDTGYNEEVNAMKPYLIKTSNLPQIDSTAIYANYFTVRDMALAKKYELDELSDTLTSKFGVKFKIDKTQIVGEPIRLSNGIVYVMKKTEVALKKRLIPTKIEGENHGGFYNVNRNRLVYRDRVYDGLPFQDIIVREPFAAGPILTYSGKDFFSTTYKVKWRAVNDFQTLVFQQRLIIYGKREVVNDFTNFSQIIHSFPYKNVDLNVYVPDLIGEFTLDKARDLDYINLVGYTTTGAGTNCLTLDYLIFVPQVKN